MSKFKKAMFASAIFLTVVGPGIAHASDPDDSGIWKQSDPSIWGSDDSSETSSDNSQTKSSSAPMSPGSKEPYVDQFGLPHAGVAVINGVAVTTASPEQAPRDFAYVPPPPRAADDGAATGSPLPSSSPSPTSPEVTNMVRKSLGQPLVKKTNSDDTDDNDDTDASPDGDDQQ